MKKTDFIIGFLILMNVILVAIIIDMRETSKIKVNEIVVQSDKEKIVFAGDSITDQYDVTSYYQYKDKLIINSGIGGYQTTDMLRRFDNLIEQHQADKLFLMIGTNDLNVKRNRDEIVSNIQKIIEQTKEKSPKTKIYYETIYPVNKAGNRKNEDIQYINSKMLDYCNNNNITYIDVYSALVGEDGLLDASYTVDGLHLNDAGYAVVTNLLRDYVEE